MTIFNRVKAKSYFLVACIFIIASGSLPAANLHLFLVGDYDSSELLPALKYDIANIRQEAKEISKNTELKVVETILVGANARTSIVLGKLHALKAGLNDVIFFYFTGHGFRTNSKGDDPWPYIFFANEYKGIDFSEVCNILEQKNARLNILIVDGCNNVLSDDAITIVKELLMSVSYSKVVRENYRNLFLNAEGTIAMAACRPGQTSLALSNGSLYTLSFLKCLHTVVKSTGANWPLLLDQTTQWAENWAVKIHELQSPIYSISTKEL